MTLSFFYKCIAILVASNYISFQIELFDEEYERNHPTASSAPTIHYSSINWESFDKENVQKAFSFDGVIQIILLFPLPHQLGFVLELNRPFHLIQDNSPPVNI